MYGDPFTPGQFVMRPVNFTDQGLKGITAPNFEVFVKNLVMPGWGLYAFGPILLLALIPQLKGDAELVLPRRERRMTLFLIGTFMLFCAMNRYSLMQFNSGFRYLLPVVPFAFLQASDVLARVSKRTLVVITVIAVAHTTVLSMSRVGQHDREGPARRSRGGRGQRIRARRLLETHHDRDARAAVLAPFPDPGPTAARG